MTFSRLITIWPGQPALSILVWVAVLVALMYLGRTQAHKGILSLARVINNAMRLAAKSILRAEEGLQRRNKEVLLACGQETVERQLEREFHRVDLVVKRDLSGYPALNRSLSNLVSRIDEDYRESTEVPPTPPAWIKAVNSVAKIPPTGDSMVSEILGNIHTTLEGQHKKAMDEYREATNKRHKLLGKMTPFWRKLSQTLTKVDKTITGLQERSEVIDSKMQEYEEIRKGTDSSVRALTSSSMTQFVIAGFVLLIAIGGAMINFNLIALPMSEMVGGGSYIGPYKASNVAALVIIMVEVTMGLFLMESLRITKLFPIISAMDDKMRNRMVYITFGILVVLASVEASLAFMRDVIAADMQALRQTLANVEAVESSTSWIPTVGQMVMGFILPFALTFVAIPLESFIHSARTVGGVVFTASLRALAFVLRLVGNIVKQLGNVLVNVYDLIILLPLWIERHAHRGHGSTTDVEEHTEISSHPSGSAESGGGGIL
jgi:hypothetical protein